MSQRIRFGIFDFDPETQELRREGTAVRMQAQPAQVLGILLAHADEIVTRDQLREEVWGSDTYVDFDRSINYCIAQIRSALGDSADKPRFIQTLPKKGYRFLGPVECNHRPQAKAEDAPAPPPRPRRWIRWAAIAAAAIVVAWLASAAVERARTVKIAVARFDNQTGAPEMNGFADGLTDLVVTDLAAGAPSRFQVIGNAAILRLPRDARDIAEIGRRLGVKYIILGQVQKSSTKLRVLAHLIRLPEQTHVDVVRYDRDVTDGLETESELGHLITTTFLHRLGS